MTLNEVNTDTIRYGYAWLNSTHSNHGGLEKMFDNWLKELKAKVWAEGYATGHDCVGAATDCTRRPNPYH